MKTWKMSVTINNQNRFRSREKTSLMTLYLVMNKAPNSVPNTEKTKKYVINNEMIVFTRTVVNVNN